MKKVYVITCTTQASRMCEFTLSVVEWVFTSKKTANKQLDIIKDKIEHGGWWSDADGNPKYGKVLSDTNMEDTNFMGVLRDVMIEIDIVEVEYDGHSYLVFDGHGVLHNPKV